AQEGGRRGRGQEGQGAQGRPGRRAGEDERARRSGAGRLSHAAGDCPPLRITEVDGRVRLGLEGLGDVEGATLQEAADELVAYVLGVAMALHAGGIGPVSTECSPDMALLGFIWSIGEHAAAGGDVRELLFAGGPNAKL